MPCLLFIQLEYLFCALINSCCTNPSVIFNSVSAFFSVKNVKKGLKKVQIGYPCADSSSVILAKIQLIFSVDFELDPHFVTLSVSVLFTFYFLLRLS